MDPRRNDVLYLRVSSISNVCIHTNDYLKSTLYYLANVQTGGIVWFGEGHPTLDLKESLEVGVILPLRLP
jgi:hypothetical protein